jgi:hypothetical protein
MHKSIGPSRNWPHRLVTDPSTRTARSLAATVRAWLLASNEPRPLLNLPDLLAMAGFKIRVGKLGGDRGGTEGLLIPRDDGCFTVSVDPMPQGGWGSTSERLRRETGAHRTRFRIAHELAHSFFYDRSPTRPARATAVGRPSEEAFCDEFARALLVPPAAVAQLPPTSDSIMKLHRVYDVSVEVAARSMASDHPARPAVALFFWTDRDPTALVLQWSNASHRDRLRGYAVEAAEGREPSSGSRSVRILKRRRQIVVVSVPTSTKRAAA